MIYLRSTSYMSASSGSLVIALKLKAKYILYSRHVVCHYTKLIVRNV